MSALIIASDKKYPSKNTRSYKQLRTVRNPVVRKILHPPFYSGQNPNIPICAELCTRFTVS